jgi:hypothetical protein
VRTLRWFLLTAFAAALVATTASAAFAGAAKRFPIAGTYSGTASTQVDGNTATIVANGTGKSTTLGSGKLTGNGTADTSQQPCTPFGGTGKLTGVGSVITFKVPVSSTGCGDEGGHLFAIKGVFQIVKVTGKLAKAKGSLRFSGTYSHDDGTFSIKLTGSLTK